MASARRATFLIDKEGKVFEEQVDNEAVDPTKIVDACQLRKTSK
jgi:peroxiredoxin